MNTRGRSALCISGILDKYLDTLVSPNYLSTMKAKRVRDFLSQISYNLSSTAGQVLSNNLTASQMSNSIQELLRSHSELKPTVFSSLVKVCEFFHCIQKLFNCQLSLECYFSSFVKLHPIIQSMKMVGYEYCRI